MIELVEKMESEGEAVDTVTLAYDLRQKSRQRVRLDSGREAALLLPPSSSHLKTATRRSSGRKSSVSSAVPEKG